MRRTITATVWIAAAALGLNALRLGAVRWIETRPAARLVTSPGAIETIPHTVIIDPPTGSQKQGVSAGVTLITAVRSDGSNVKRFDSLNSRSPVSSRIIVMASGEVVTTDDVREEKTIFGREKHLAATLRDPRSGCRNSFTGQPFARDEELTDGETVLGYRTVKVTQKQKTSWLAPDLGCAVLKTRLLHPSGEVIEQTATRALKGEPAAEMFELPAHYKEVAAKLR